MWGKAKNPSKLGFLTGLLRSFFWGFFGRIFPGQMGKITDFAKNLLRRFYVTVSGVLPEPLFASQKA